MDALVQLEGGGEYATCPHCGDAGLHPFVPDSVLLECRSCGKEFRKDAAMKCNHRARGDGGVLQCTLDPGHEGIHHSGDWFWNQGDTDATRGESAELAELACVRCGAVPVLDDWGEITGWTAASDDGCEHSLAEEPAP